MCSPLPIDMYEPSPTEKRQSHGYVYTLHGMRGYLSCRLTGSATTTGAGRGAEELSHALRLLKVGGEQGRPVGGHLVAGGLIMRTIGHKKNQGQHYVRIVMVYTMVWCIKVKAVHGLARLPDYSSHNEWKGL